LIDLDLKTYTSRTLLQAWKINEGFFVLFPVQFKLLFIIPCTYLFVWLAYNRSKTRARLGYISHSKQDQLSPHAQIQRGEIRWQSTHQFKVIGNCEFMKIVCFFKRQIWNQQSCGGTWSK
jgi:hypothetical protein